MPSTPDRSVTRDETVAFGKKNETGKVERDGGSMVARFADGQAILRWEDWEVRCAVTNERLGDEKGVTLGAGCRAAVVSGSRSVNLRSLYVIAPLLLISVVYVLFDLRVSMVSTVIALGLVALVGVKVFRSGRNQRNWLAIFEHGLAIGDQRGFSVLPWGSVVAARAESDMYRGVLEVVFAVETSDKTRYQFRHSAVIRTPRARRLEVAAAELNALRPKTSESTEPRPATADTTPVASGGSVIS